jgi:starvation-inducible DNA-binding protein
MKNHENPPTEHSRRSARSEPSTVSKPRAARPAPPEPIVGSGPEQAGIAALLNGLLADEFVLYTKMLNYHWNVRGMQFHSLHPFLEQLYQAQFRAVDDLAERVRTVGGTALGSLASFLRDSLLKEQEGSPPDPRAMISNLLRDQEMILESLRTAIEQMEDPFDDPGTCNLLLNLLERQEKTAWMLRTHLDMDFS